MIRPRKPFATVLSLAAVVLAGAQEKSADPQDEKAKATLERTCTSCHDLNTVTDTRRTRALWQQVVDDMVSRGAEGSDQDLAAVVGYLTKFYGQVNVNTAAPEQLRGELGLTEKEAQAIVAYRDQNGKIKDFEQLLTVPGVSAEKLKEKRSLIAFSQ